MTNEEPGAPNAPLSDATRHRLDAVRRGLLHLHKALLEGQRRDYEQIYGRVASGGELLHLVIHHAWFAWLRPVSEVVVQMDAMLDARADAEEEPVTEGAAQDLLRQVRLLLKPSQEGEGFGRRYYQALQQDPNTVLAHAAVVRLLPPDPTPER